VPTLPTCENHLLDLSLISLKSQTNGLDGATSEKSVCPSSAARQSTKQQICCDHDSHGLRLPIILLANTSTHNLGGGAALSRERGSNDSRFTARAHLQSIQGQGAARPHVCVKESHHNRASHPTPPRRNGHGHHGSRPACQGLVLEMRSAKNEKFASLLPNNLNSCLDELDDWLFSEEAENATKEEMTTKSEATLHKTKHELCPACFAAIQKEQAAKELEMEQEAKRAQLERDGQHPPEEGAEEEEDHDNRRLPKKRRMEIVLKNKKEANELFSDRNFKFAAARHTKALSHCAKFVDLNPDDLEEVTAVMLSLNLNLALASCKLENYDQALRVCDEAVVLDPNSAKALHRRASVFCEKKRWSAAMADVTSALKGSPEGRGAIVKLQDKIDWQNKMPRKRKWRKRCSSK
jgi:tetratricopeptide (TPR) repeat protein